MKRKNKSLERLLKSAIIMVRKNKNQLIKVNIESQKHPLTNEDTLHIEFIYVLPEKTKGKKKGK